MSYSRRELPPHLPSPMEVDANPDVLTSDHLAVRFTIPSSNQSLDHTTFINTYNVMAPGSSVYSSVNYRNSGCYCFTMENDPREMSLKQWRKMERPVAIIAWEGRLFFYNQNVEWPRKPYIAELYADTPLPVEEMEDEDRAFITTSVCIGSELFRQYMQDCQSFIQFKDKETGIESNSVRVINELAFLQSQPVDNIEIIKDKDALYRETSYTARRYQRIIDDTSMQMEKDVGIFCFQEVDYVLSDQLRSAFGKKYGFLQSFSGDNVRRIPDELLTFYDRDMYELYDEHAVKLIHADAGKEFVTVLRDKRTNDVLCIHNTHGNYDASMETLIEHRKQSIKDDKERVKPEDQSKVRSIFIGDMNQGVSNIANQGTAAVLGFRDEAGKRGLSQYTIPYDGAYISNARGGFDQLPGEIITSSIPPVIQCETGVISVSSLSESDNASVSSHGSMNVDLTGLSCFLEAPPQSSPEILYQVCCPADNHQVVIGESTMLMSQYVANMRHLVDDFALYEAVPLLPYGSQPYQTGYGIKINDVDFETRKAELPQQKVYEHHNNEDVMFIKQENMSTFHHLVLDQKIKVIQDEIDRLSSLGWYQCLIFWKTNPALKVQILEGLKAVLGHFKNCPDSNTSSTIGDYINAWMNNVQPPLTKSYKQILNESRGFFNTSKIVEKLESHHIIPKP